MTAIIVPMTIEEELTIVPMDIEEEQNIISIEIHQDQELIPVMFASPIQIIGDVDYYDGSYDIVPSQQDQVISIDGKMGRQNIIVEKIPSYYGLITYNGVSLIVS